MAFSGLPFVYLVGMASATDCFWHPSQHVCKVDPNLECAKFAASPADFDADHTTIMTAKCKCLASTTETTCAAQSGTAGELCSWGAGLYCSSGAEYAAIVAAGATSLVGRIEVGKGETGCRTANATLATCQAFSGSRCKGYADEETGTVHCSADVAGVMIYDGKGVVKELGHATLQCSDSYNADQCALVTVGPKTMGDCQFSEDEGCKASRKAECVVFDAESYDSSFVGWLEAPCKCFKYTTYESCMDKSVSEGCRWDDDICEGRSADKFWETRPAGSQAKGAYDEYKACGALKTEATCVGNCDWKAGKSECDGNFGKIFEALGGSAGKIGKHHTTCGAVTVPATCRGKTLEFTSPGDDGSFASIGQGLGLVGAILIGHILQ